MVASKGISVPLASVSFKVISASTLVLVASVLSVSRTYSLKAIEMANEGNKSVEPSTGLSVTVGGEVSIMIALLAPRDPVAPGAGSVKVAALPSESFNVPLFNARALVLV